MGYDVHITKKVEWFGDGPEIPLREWLSAVASDSEMRLDGYAEAPLPDGGKLRMESEGLAVWTGYSKHGLNNNMAWFLFRNGNVSVKNPDQEIIEKMCSLANVLDAKVVGDEGELYQLSVAPAASLPAKKRWWKPW